MTTGMTEANSDRTEVNEDTDVTTSLEADRDDLDDSDIDVPAGPDDGSGDDADAETISVARARWMPADWTRVVAYGLLPALALVLFLGAGYLKWVDTTNRDARSAAAQTVQAARDSTVALLSYTPADVDKQLVEVRDRLTGKFRESYTSLTDDVVIPGSKQQQITTVATVPAAASVSAAASHAVVLLFVNQTTTVGNGRPTDMASTVRVTLDRVDGRWLISEFDPV